MILINMPIPTINGWSYNFYNRIKNYVSENFGNFQEEIILYPDYTHYYSSKDYYLQSIIMRGAFESLDYLFKNKLYLKKIRQEISKIIFLDANQGVDEQINFLKNEVFISLKYPKIYVLYYLDPSYINAFNNKSDVLKSYFDRANNYDAILIGNPYSVEHFNNYFGEEKFILGTNAFVVGGCLDKVNVNFKIPRSIFWAGRISNPTKDFDKFISIVGDERFSNYEFYIAADLDDFSKLSLYKSNYSNLNVVLANNTIEYNKRASKCKFILSTAKCETFGYAIFDAATTFTIPILPDIPSSYRFFDKKFLYNSIDDISEILEYFTYSKKFYEDETYDKFNALLYRFSTENFVRRILEL